MRSTSNATSWASSCWRKRFSLSCLLCPKSNTVKVIDVVFIVPASEGLSRGGECAMQARFKEPHKVAGIFFSRLFNSSLELLQSLKATSWVPFLEAKLMIVHFHRTSNISLLAGSQNNAVWSASWPCEKSTRAGRVRMAAFDFPQLIL